MSLRGEIGLALLLVAVVGTAVIAGRQPVGETRVDHRTSTLLAGPRGTKALYDLQIRLGRHAERRRTPLFDLARDTARSPDLVILAAPAIPLETGELNAVARYVRSGGAVLAVEAAGGFTACAGWSAVWSGDDPTDSTAVVSRPAARRLPPVRHQLEPLGALRTPRRSPARDTGWRPSSDDALWCRLPSPVHADTLVRTLARAPVVLTLAYEGGGRVMLVAEPDYFRNRLWRESQVPYVLAPLLTPAPPARVVWDEYHQGFGDAPSLAGTLLSWLTQVPAGWVLLHIAAVALLWLAVAAVRFGPARPAIHRPRRSPLEHVGALAAGLEGADGSDVAVDLIVNGLRRRLRSAAATPADTPRWLDGLELALTDRGRWAARRLRGVLDRSGGAERVVAAAHAVEDVWEQLRPSRTPG